MPKVDLVSTCVDSFAVSFNGTYDPNPYLYNPSTPSDQKFFTRTDRLPYQRFFFRLASADGIDLSLVLSDGVVEFTSALTFDGFPDVAQGVWYSLGSCGFAISVAPGSRALLPPPLVYDLNYIDNVFPPFLYRSMVCNYCVGYLNFDGLWACPFCCEGCE